MKKISTIDATFNRIKSVIPLVDEVAYKYMSTGNDNNFDFYMI